MKDTTKATETEAKRKLKTKFFKFPRISACLIYPQCTFDLGKNKLFKTLKITCRISKSKGNDIHAYEQGTCNNEFSLMFQA